MLPSHKIHIVDVEVDKAQFQSPNPWLTGPLDASRLSWDSVAEDGPCLP